MELMLSCPGDTFVLEIAFSAPRLGRHELVPIFYCNNSIAILYYIVMDSMGLQISVMSII